MFDTVTCRRCGARMTKAFLAANRMRWDCPNNCRETVPKPAAEVGPVGDVSPVIIRQIEGADGE